MCIRDRSWTVYATLAVARKNESSERIHLEITTDKRSRDAAAVAAVAGNVVVVYIAFLICYSWPVRSVDGTMYGPCDRATVRRREMLSVPD